MNYDADEHDDDGFADTQEVSLGGRIRHIWKSSTCCGFRWHKKKSHWHVLASEPIGCSIVGHLCMDTINKHAFICIVIYNSIQLNSFHLGI